MAPTIKQVKQRYNRFSFFYDIVEWPMEKLFFKKWRAKLLHNVHGRVLEVGIGTGKNLPYYNYKNVKLVGVDISKGMLSKARKKTKKNKYPVTLQLIKSDNLPFKNNSFDYVVCTFLLCSVPNQKNMLKEMQRVLKKNGKIIMLEHVLSKNKLIALMENIHNPITKLVFGFNTNRDTVRNIKKSGLKITKEENLALYDVFKRIEAKK